MTNMAPLVVTVPEAMKYHVVAIFRNRFVVESSAPCQRHAQFVPMFSAALDVDANQSEKRSMPFECLA